MRKKFFFDTNVLIYAVDSHDKQKQNLAKNAIIEHAHKSVISTQILQEFFVAATKKLHISPLEAKELAQKLGGFQCIQITTDIIYQAMDIMILNKISFWDALVVASALAGGCNCVLSEDMQDGQNISGILVENPFKRPTRH
jgi:predicted nucleic acid-binding protein